MNYPKTEITKVIYDEIKSDVLKFLANLRAANPTAADYLEKHIVFDDEKETFMYTGDDRLKLMKPLEWN